MIMKLIDKQESNSKWLFKHIGCLNPFKEFMYLQLKELLFQRLLMKLYLKIRITNY